MLVHLIASKPTDSVTYGFLPAAARLGVDVILLTDQPGAHERALRRAEGTNRPGVLPGQGTSAGGQPPPSIVECDPWDPRALIARMAALPDPDGVLTNSDHLQVQTALAAAYYGLPGKDWRSALRAKDKSLMRRRLAETGSERVTAVEITAATEYPVPGLSYPVVLKPAEGVASEDVVLASDAAGLALHSAEILARRPGARLIAEQYLPGTLRTLETIGDGTTTWVLGGFRTDLSAPPFFIEERLTWDAPRPAAVTGHVLGALASLGVSFGACHTEFVTGEDGRAQLIEVNDRLIGDHCDFVLSDLLGVDLFEVAVRVSLGEPLPAAAPAPPPDRGCAIIDYVTADQAGVLAAVPRHGEHPAGPGVTLSYRSLRQPGERITVTNTNRDYLGVISALGPDEASVCDGIGEFRRRSVWELAAESSR